MRHRQNIQLIQMQHNFMNCALLSPINAVVDEKVLVN